ncbi:hypothetical protein ACEE90_04230 [Corynebacterium phoceense]
MRNFRTAAVAAATAVTVALSGTAIASAQSEPDQKPATNSSKISEALSSKPEEGKTLSSKVGDATDGDEEVAGANLLGKRTDDANNPEWAKIWRDGTFALIGTTIAGALIAAYNFAVYNHILPNHILDPMFNR